MWPSLIILCVVAAQSAPQQGEIVEAAKAGNRQRVEQLLKQGIPINAHDAHGRTALHEAAATENVELFQLLISAGGDPFAKDNDGVTPEYIVRHIRTFAISVAMQRALMKRTLRPPPNAPWTLTAAIAHRQTSVVQMLLEMRADANAKDANGDYPLDLAAQKGDTQIVQLLLAHGADVTLRNRSGSAPIHTAALNGHTEIVKLLLDKGADINSRAVPTGETPLFFAAAFGRTDTVELLLTRGADKTIANNRGITALAAAVKAEQSDAANLPRRGK